MKTYSCGLIKTISLVISKHFITFSIASRLTCFDWYIIKDMLVMEFKSCVLFFLLHPMLSFTLCLFQQWCFLENKSCGVQEFKWGICTTCHTYGWGSHYRVEEVTRSDNKATPVARYQRKSYCRERVLEKGLALTWLNGWWLPPHLMHPTKPPGCIYVEKTSEQCCLGCSNSQ